MGQVRHVTDDDFEAEVLKSDVPVLVDFYAVWCGPCKSLAPIVEELSTEYEGRAKIFKVDIDQAPDTASTHGIMAVPTLILFKDGKAQQMLTGFKPKPELEKALQSVL